MNIYTIEPPATSKNGVQRIYGGNGSNKSDFRKAPIDVLWMSGYLRKNGFDNIFHDSNNSRESFEDIKKLFNLNKPDIIFFSTSTCTIYSDVQLAKIAKKINSECITVAFGTHIMELTNETLNESPDLDIGIYSNEWELVALDIVNNRDDLSKAKGIVYRDEFGKLNKTVPHPQLEHYDDLGFPAHDKLDQSLYADPTMRRSPKTMVQFSRSCIAKCSFCCQPSFFGNVMKRSVDSIISEMKWVREIGFKEVFINDATFTFDHDWNKEIFQRMIDEKIDLSWWCTTRSHCLDEELLVLMKRAGCHTIGVGFESADDEVLKNIKKGVRLDYIKNAVKMSRDANIDILLFCVVGFLGETKQSMYETISFLKTLKASFITLGIAVPAPGTGFYRQMEEAGYLKHKKWDLYDPLKIPVYNYPDLTAEEIYDAAAYGLRQFYLRPSYIFDRLKSVENPKQFFRYVKNFGGFLKRYVRPKVAA
ncbi:MAG: hypothetical protein CMG74_04065 [Candidatus Marinimicrobia bacterium]|nr:hypothetical protein [Candidatus Neomarinimicrobiota bacterium]|tara:strand:+ start:34531 stop:35961 length:1431 start_codon:yes stop_codon:yes gene_type:complete